MKIAPFLALAFAALAATHAVAAPSEDDRLHGLIAKAAAEELTHDPTRRTRETLTGSDAAWTPISDAARRQAADRSRKRTADLDRSIKVARLSAGGRMDYDIYRSTLANEQLRAKAMEEGFFLYGNVFDPAMDLPDTLMNFHAVRSAQDARNYIARLNALPQALDDVLAAADVRAARGVVMIKPAYAQLAGQAKSLSTGAPCGGEGDNKLAKAFRQKLDAAKLAGAEREALLAQADAAMTDKVCPAYGAFAVRVAAMEAKGRTDGAWVLPKGDVFYRDTLEISLGERTDPHAIHDKGLAEVVRLKAEMLKLAQKVGFKGDLDELNTFLRTSETVSLPHTPEGEKAYEDKARAYLDDIYKRLPNYFLVVPTTPVVVQKALVGPTGGPPGGGSYFTEAPADHSRPAIYNLSIPNTPRIETWSLATVSFHEIAPGHHLQTEIFRAAQGQNAYPRPFYSGYFDGWALYAEDLAGEMGAYDGDDYARLGWLQKQLVRAVRVVVDTGLNSEHWSPEQALAYQQANAATEDRLNRFLNWPAQGLSYYWGYLEFKRLRAKAETELGPRFDIKGFHNAVLAPGPVPLSILDVAVERWIAEVKATPAPATPGK